MNFISLEFAIFLGIILALLAVSKSLTIRKWILLLASIVFYAFFDFRFLGVITVIILLDYFLGKALTMQGGNLVGRRLLFWVGILVNLGVLGLFKYFNFFIGSINVILFPGGGGLETLAILLPVGISFYIFQSISYLVDVYRRTCTPATSLTDLALYLLFFPRLVAGPIIRPTDFFNQLARFRVDILGLSEGTQLFLRGALKKLVIADNLSFMVDRVYLVPSVFSPITVWLTVTAYAVQILFDFSGYTDMARGIGRMLGFNLPQNFDLPYTARTVSEFWTRWHISLSSWFRDYLFLPLAYALSRRMKRERTLFIKTELVIYVVAILVTFLLTGLWHGASWSFVLWGGLFGLYLGVERTLYGAHLVRSPWNRPTVWLRSLLVFVLVALTWIPFRSPDAQTTRVILEKLLFTSSQYHFDWFNTWALFAVPAVLIGGFLVRIFGWKWPSLNLSKPYTPAILLFEILLIFFFAYMGNNPFIYAQF